MRKIIAIILCKVLRLIGKAVGKGSSLPGKFALKVCPDVLGRVKLPKYVIAVTGSNGKTSTTEMIAHILRQGGFNVALNQEGSNQIEGVTTFILNNCTLFGRVRSDVLLIESDERYAKYTFKYFAPTHYVITNLYRDQLTRNGHPMWVFNAIKESISEKSRLILNADDPLVSLFAYGREDTVWFGADKLASDSEEFTSVYNDSVYCPVCQEKMDYSTYHYNHIGHYFCRGCGFSRQDTDFTVTKADLTEGFAEINGEFTIQLALKSLYNIYNILAAFTVCSIMGMAGGDIASHINNYVLKNGRIVTFKLGGRRGTLLTSKHENSISYDQSLKIAADDSDGCDVMIIVDAVSRKYFTSDVSWLWDIDFHLLGSENVKKIVLAGAYANDLAARFSYTDIDSEKIVVIESIAEAVEEVNCERSEKLYVITCFSDKGKFLERVEVE
ncbi:MAG: DUF1727 domain-containing protein [Clostridia bacterium]|nr:DUF1727 domain-containing protein [Clostridia bacterium]